MRNLTVLNVSGWMNSLTDADLETISSANPNLTVLDVSDCMLVGDAGLIAVANRCPLLESVDLSRCVCITTEIIDRFADCPSMRHLRAFGSDSSIRSQVMRRNPRIRFNGQVRHNRCGELLHTSYDSFWDELRHFFQPPAM
eukprot:m.384220 g.384220  ORF g.384220 m.384220 type:complete len:141 (+) comp56268_c0_seq11:2-424(+)